MHMLYAYFRHAVHEQIALPLLLSPFSLVGTGCTTLASGCRIELQQVAMNGQKFWSTLQGTGC